jgi:Uma2 family endonuclease
MHVAIPETNLAEVVVLSAKSFSDDETFAELCAANPDLRLERTSTGEVLIMAPAGSEAGYQNGEIFRQLSNWAIANGIGKAFDSSAGFRLPNGAIRSADCAWVRKDILATFSKEAKRKFLPLSPNFVIEVASPSDDLTDIRNKMREWLEQGSPLGWLIDPESQTVEIYRTGQATERLQGVQSLHADGLVKGFVLELVDVWAGL